MYKEYEFFKPVATAYSNRVSDLQSYVALYNDAKSKYSDQYSKIVIESMVTDLEKDEKIIKNISKATSINK